MRSAWRVHVAALLLIATATDMAISADQPAVALPDGVARFGI